MKLDNRGRQLFHYIYKTTFLNGKIYIGQRQHHCPEKDRYYFGTGIWVNRIIKKHGKIGLKKEILMIIPYNKNKIDIWEKIFILKFKSTNKKIGYNLLVGASGSTTLSFLEESKKKISETKKAQKLKMPEHVKLNLININTGKKRTEEHKEKLKKANLGKKASIETKNKLSKSIKNSYNNLEHKKNNELHLKSARSKILYDKKTYEKVSNSLKGKTFIWITNGITSSTLWNGESIPPGFKRGRIYNRKINSPT